MAVDTEKLAEAIWESEPNVGLWCDWADLVGDPEHQPNLDLAEKYRRYARAALAALRRVAEPEGDTAEARKMVAELQRLGEAASRPSDGGWRIFDSNFFDWLASKRVGPENLAYLRFLWLNGNRIAAIADDRVARLRGVLVDALLQLEYLDCRFPTGTTQTAIARINAALEDTRDGN